MKLVCWLKGVKEVGLAVQDLICHPACRIGIKFYPQKLRAWQTVDLQPKTQMYIAITVSSTKMVMNAYDVKSTLRDSITLEK